MSRSSRSDYGKGHRDGVKHAKHERTATVVDLISDQVSDPRYDRKGSPTYKEGFRDGRKSEQSKKK